MKPLLPGFYTCSPRYILLNPWLAMPYIPLSPWTEPVKVGGPPCTGALQALHHTWPHIVSCRGHVLTPPGNGDGACTHLNHANRQTLATARSIRTRIFAMALRSRHHSLTH